jgi:hypothetical protein
MIAVARNRLRMVRRRWRAWRARVERKRLALALVALLTIGLGEPLLCIIHCDLWLPSMFGHQMASHQHHHHGAMAGMDHSGSIVGMDQASTSPGMINPIGAQPAENGAPCFHGGPNDGSEAPFHVPPSPIHDMLPLTLVVTVVVSMLFVYRPVPPGDPPRIFLSLLLRPPIPFAA